MPTASTFLLLAGAALALFVVPGPAVMFIVARSVEQGRSAGLTSAVGVALGSQVHSLFAALGLSVVLARSAALFTAVKLAGAAYLIVMGLRKLWARRLGGVPPRRRSSCSGSPSVRSDSAATPCTLSPPASPANDYVDGWAAPVGSIGPPASSTWRSA